jgi:large subunit ribosomal protein L18e
MKKTRTTNPELKHVIHFLKKQSVENKVNIWVDLADRLSKPKRRRIAINLSRLNRHTQRNEMVAVPGKVLGTGEITHPITVAAFAFSEKARLKIARAKGKPLTFDDLIKKNPKGSKVKIIG